RAILRAETPLLFRHWRSRATRVAARRLTDMKLGAASSANGTLSTVSSGQAWVQGLWMDFRRRGAATCTRCGESCPLAMAVRDAPRGYQLQCVQCGWATPWFDWRDGEIALL